MNVVYYSSDFFAEMCGVSIQSLCENNKDSDTIIVYVVEDKISDINKQRLTAITDRYGRFIKFIRMPSQEECYPGVAINLGRTYARMALGEILPESVDRVLSLDSDTLVVDSLKEMYSTEFEDNQYVAGVYDCLGRAIQTRVLKAKDDLLYCNAGMFLIDLKKWRKKYIGQRLLDAVLENADGNHVMYFLEQDLMNLTFYKDLKLLHPRYNLLTSIAFFDYKEIIKMKKPVTYYMQAEVECAKKHPALLHATTCFYVKKRMWVENSDHPFHSKYLYYRNQTEWKNEPLIQDERTKKKKIYAAFWHVMPRTLAVFVASFLINKVRPLYAIITTKLKISTIAEQSAT